MVVTILKRSVQAALLRRDVFLWMFFEGSATGDALVLVAGTGIILALAGPATFSVSLFFQVLINSLFMWLVVSALVWASAKFALEANGEYAPVLRVVGFATPTLLVWLVTTRVFDGALAIIVGAVWFLAVIAAGLQVVMEMRPDRAWAAAGMGFVGWLLLQILLGGLSFA